jgi:hypothetical protein
LEQVRLSFIYLSFITAGVHLVVYLVMAFVLQHKEHIKQPFKSAARSGNCDRRNSRTPYRWDPQYRCSTLHQGGSTPKWVAGKQ